MNHRKHKQAKNLKKKVYTPDGYIKDPPDAECPHCGQKDKSCSYVNSLSRAWARSACAKKHSTKSSEG
jgi:prepilin signal peptidase PulO-like enzyme (type II secretory pathway)